LWHNAAIAGPGEAGNSAPRQGWRVAA
jgi:hypothetical protein